ncbi:MAG: BrnT family toxin [Candidatus Lambdaproteobacteria bacterium]|nr:BrnT family toxin [Candidatus Lambdaproteobacteria bacterium]
MKIEFDPAKSERNALERDLPYVLAAEFEWETATYREDTRRAYTERRFVAIGHLGNRLHVICFTPIPGGVRLISFRKANEREVRRHAQETREAPDE